MRETTNYFFFRQIEISFSLHESNIQRKEFFLLKIRSFCLLVHKHCCIRSTEIDKSIFYQYAFKRKGVLLQQKK